ncbi:cell death protein hid [Aedes albopictus]|uniref:Uncharacterized protein n=1 Tax=Aedes albopictus TaxID=7160 RepID=A0ABM1YVD9_AEDAL
MAIPFLQPEEDESARHHGTNGLNTTAAHAGVGAGAGSSGTGSASASGSGAVVVGGAGSSSGGAVMLAGATGPLPVPNSPAAPIISSGTSTAVQTPLIGPMNSDQLVQLFYEALYRYSRGDTPSTPISQSPQSSSCSPFTTGYYNSGGGGSAGYANATTTGQVFFPQTPNGVFRPGGGGGIGSYGATTGGVFFGQPPTPSPSGSSSHSSQHSANSPETAACSSAPPIIHHFPSSYQLPSTSNASTATTWPHVPSGHLGDGDDSSESDSSQPSSGSDGDSITAPIAGCSPHCLGLLGPPHHHLHELLDAAAAAGSGSSTGVSGSFNNGSSSSSSSSNSAGGSSAMVPMSGYIPPHLDYMAGREQLQEFAGKIPQRKKKSSSSKSSSKSKKSKFLEQTLVWPTLAVTATLIALGCGLLAAR